MKVFIAIVATFFATAIILGGIGVAFKVKGGFVKSIPLAVNVENPLRGDLIEVIEAPGEVEPIRKVEIRSKISAKIIELAYKEGDLVTKGDPNANPPIAASVLVRLDSKDLEADLRGANLRYKSQAARIEISRINLESRKERLKGERAVLEQAERDLKKNEELLKTGDVNLSDVEQQRSTLINMRFQLASSEMSIKAEEQSLGASQLDLEASKAGIAQKEEQLKYTKFDSPMDGIVTRVNAEVGEMATGSLYNPGTVILEVADLSQMMVAARVDEADISKIKVGQQAKVHIQAWPDEVFTGVVATTALAPSNQQLGEKFFEVEILLDNQDQQIFSGLTADVDIEIKTHRDALKVPNHAMLDQEVDLLPLEIRENSAEVDKNEIYIAVVYRYIEGEAVITPVTFGERDADHTIILSGLTEEEQIIVGPFKILEGLRHKLKVKDEGEMTEEELRISRENQSKILTATSRAAQAERDQRRRERDR